MSLRSLGPLLRSVGPACCFRLRAFSRLALCVYGRGGSSAMMLSECACIVAVVVCVAVMWQTTASVRQVQWRLPRHSRVGSASCRTSILAVSLRNPGPLLRPLGLRALFRLRAFVRLALCVHGRRVGAAR